MQYEGGNFFPAHDVCHTLRSGSDTRLCHRRGYGQSDYNLRVRRNAMRYCGLRCDDTMSARELRGSFDDVGSVGSVWWCEVEKLVGQGFKYSRNGWFDQLIGSVTWQENKNGVLMCESNDMPETARLWIGL